MRVILLLFLLLGVATTGFSQKEATFWYFNQRAGFDFSNGQPVPLNNSPMIATYPCATISDKTTGELLFYSNGEKVWNRHHQVMPNGTGIIPGTHHLVPSPSPPNYTTQGALIVPFPEDANRYYLFTLDIAAPLLSSGSLAGAITELYYSVIDMRLDNGRGDVVSEAKNVFVTTGLTEKLTAIPHANGQDYWIITHEWASNVFQVRLLSINGLAAPQRMAVGPSIPHNLQDTVGLFNKNGQFLGHPESSGFLKASPNGKKLACSAMGSGHVNLFDFDAATGAISNPIDLGSFQDAFGISFSPDNTKLYVVNFNHPVGNIGHNIINQYDVTLDSSAIVASGKSIVYENPFTNINWKYQGFTPYALQIGLDGRIYGASGYSAMDEPFNPHNMFVINQPNKAGFACDVQYQTFDFGTGDGSGGLPNFIQSYFNGLEPGGNGSSACNPDRAITVFPNPTEGSFKIQINSDCYQINQVTIFNSIGQLIGSIQTDEVTGVIDISALAAGLYVLQIETNTKDIIKKLIKI